MTTRLIALTVLLVLAACTLPRAQTIDERDLPFFIGAISVPDPANRDSLDLARFAAFYIDSVHRRWENVPSARDSHWIWLAVNGEPLNVGDYYYATMVKFVDGPEDGFVNLLTVWRAGDGGLVTLVCISSLESGTGYAVSRALAAVCLPDSSLLLQIELSGGDGNIQINNAFLRGTNSCHFETFYSVAWDSEDSVSKSVLSDELREGHYRATIVTEFVTHDSLALQEGTYTPTLDSAHAEVIDIWQLAVQKFGIDTTRIELHQR